MKKILVVLSVLLAWVLATPLFADQGAAVIGPTEEGSQVEGHASFEDTPEGLLVEAEVSGAAPGKHGFHIHEYGACGDKAKAAGDHYNPDHVAHGLVTKDGFSKSHAGDLGNMEVGPDGTGRYRAVIPGLGLAGQKYTVGGRAVILHEKEDDFGQPAGNAGPRIGCGEIVIVPPKPASE